jgi:hypothetical protein
LSDNALIAEHILGGSISSFETFNNVVYAATSSSSELYAFDKARLKWNFIYKPYGSKVNDMLVTQDKLYLFVNEGSVLSYNGEKWNIETDKIDSVCSFQRALFTYNRGVFDTFRSGWKRS